jgi:hypothetical protein
LDDLGSGKIRHCLGALSSFGWKIFSSLNNSIYHKAPSTATQVIG